MWPRLKKTFLKFVRVKTSSPIEKVGNSFFDLILGLPFFKTLETSSGCKTLLENLSALSPEKISKLDINDMRDMEEKG